MVINLLQKGDIKGAGISLLLEAKGYKVEVISKPKKELRNQPELLIIDIEYFITAREVVKGYKKNYSRIILLGMLHHLHCLKSFQSPVGFVSLQSKPVALLNIINKIKKDETCFWFDEYTQKFLQKAKLERQNTLLQKSLIAPLTKTELKILKDISEGFTSEQIAEKRYRSIYTVQNHRKNIKHKFKKGSGFALSSFSILHKSSIAALNWINEYKMSGAK